MDVQTENMDSPPGESQPSGKIRKGFKLFGKRKPGNIFSIRSKGDANSKPPVIRSKTLDGLSETTTAATDLEQHTDNAQEEEVSQGETEQADEEPLSEDGVLAAAPARTSISSVSSAKSLGFLSLLRGGRRGVGDRQVHTVSQPVGRQRRGIKGLFGSVKMRSKDKEDKEDTPPSPLLMLSRASSVEIIKEDLTLTPECHPRSLDSPKSDGSVKSLPTPDKEAPLVPGDASLSSLLDDINSLLTFDSITGGGDIMADVEAEWGKASRAINARASEVPSSPKSPISKTNTSSPLMSTMVSAPAAAKPYSVAVTTAASIQSFTPLTKTTFQSVPMQTTSPILTANSVKTNLDSTTPSTPTAPATGLSTTPITLTSLSAPIMSSSSIMNRPAQSSASAAPPSPPIKASAISPPFISMAPKPSPEIVAPPPIIDSVSKPLSTSSFASAKTAVTHSFVTTPKLDSEKSANQQMFTPCKPSLSPAKGDFTAPGTVLPFCSVTTKVTTAPTSVPTSDSISSAVSKPTLPPSPMEQNKTSPSLVTTPDFSSYHSTSATTKTQPQIPVSVPTPSTTSVDKISAMAKVTPAAVVPLDKILPVPTQTLAPTTNHIPTASPTPPALGQSPKPPSTLAQIPNSLTHNPPPVTHLPISKDSSAMVQIPNSVQIPVSQPKAPHVPTAAPAPYPDLSPSSPPGDMVDLSSPTGATKTQELHGEAVRTSIQGASREKRTSQTKASGLSKIPVVGGGRGGKIPVRDSQHAEDETRRDPPTPVSEDERHFNLHDTRRSRDRICDVEADVPPLKPPQDEIQPPPQPKAVTSLPRDSKIPVKHGAQPHAASQIPQAKEPPRTKIPVSKVPVRRAGQKPAAAGGVGVQARK